MHHHDSMTGDKGKIKWSQLVAYIFVC